MKNLFISLTSTIKEALKKFNEIGEKVLIVVDENNHLLGTITDGDIRRYILNTGTIEGTVEDIYNKNPKFMYSNDPKEKAKQIMLENKIEILPIIDNQKRVINYIIWTDLFENRFEYYEPTEEIDIPVVIMAGGKGTRLDPFTKVLPKPLLPIKDKTIVEHIIESFKKFGYYRFILILNYKGKLIESYFNSIDKDYLVEFLWEDNFYGTAGALSLLKDIDSENFFVSNCDILLKINYLDVLKTHEQSKADFTTITSIKHYKVPYGVVETGENNFVKKINEKPEMTFQINTGVYLINKNILDCIPERKYLDMPDLIHMLIENNHKVLAYPINESDYLDTGQWDEYKKTLKILEGV
jgi:dTDP-glucose pyrophosphorylase/predicted transcriptional regulator